MRTGANFARGSCRALKWMLVLAAFSVLGSAQAVAQPTMIGATYTATGMNVTITLDEEAYLSLTSSIAAELAGDFAIIGGNTTATAATDATAVAPVAASGLDLTRFPGKKTISLRFDVVISSLKGAATDPALQVAYTADTARQIKATSDDDTMMATGTRDLTGPGVVTDGLSLTIPAALKDVALRRGTVIAATAAIELPAAKGGSAPENLTYSLSNLPGELVERITGADAMDPSTISGTVPIFVGEWTLVYSVTDSSPVDNASARDTLKLRSADKPARVGKPTVTVAGPSSLAVSWTAPADNYDKITEYKMRYKASAATTWTPVVATITDVKHTLTGLNPGSYDVQVRAMNKFSEVTDGTLDTDWSLSGTSGTGPAPSTPTIALAVGSTIPEGRDNVPVTVTVTVRPLPAGATATRTVVVTPVLAAPAATVKAEDAAELPSTLGTPTDVEWDIRLSAAKPASRQAMTFTFSSNLSSSQTVYVHTKTDVDAENENFRITATSAVVTGIFAKGTATAKAVMIDDAQEQKYELRLPYELETGGSLKEGNQGASVDMTLMVSPPRTIPKSFILSLASANDPSDYSLSSGGSTGNNLRIDMGVGEGAKPISLTTAANDGDRVDDTITLKMHETSATSTTAVGAQIGDDVMLTVVDQHKLPKVSLGTIMVDAVAVTSVTEGETATVMLMADRGTATDDITDTEAITITLMHGAASTASAADYSLSAAKVTIGASKESGTFKLEVLPDEQLDAEELVLMAEVTGTATYGATADTAELGPIAFVDGTMKYVYPKTDAEIQEVVYAAKEAGMGDDMMFNPGEMIEVTAAALFNAAEGITLSYTAMSDNEDVAMVSTSGSMVTVTAEDMAGVMAHITITAHASMPAGAKGLPQTDPREASVIFPVEVGLAALSIMLSGPEDMNVAEGMSAMVTATANRAATEDTTVMLMRDRAMSTADDMDFEAQPIVIEAGEMMGSTMVMAVADDMMEDMEELVLYGMTEGMAGEVTGEVKLYIWDAAVPALPIIAQLLLAALLGFGGYRRYLRRR